MAFIQCKKYGDPGGQVWWILVNPKIAGDFKQKLICSETKTS